ncbi:MAG: hypothetical protein ACE5IL_08270 [Myxococcota bacterium]
MERGAPLPAENNATTLQPRTLATDDPDLENPEFLYDAKPRPPLGAPEVSTGASEREPRAAPPEVPGDPAPAGSSGADLAGDTHAVTSYDDRSLSQFDPAGLDLSAECDPEPPVRADPPREREEVGWPDSPVAPTPGPGRSVSPVSPPGSRWPGEPGREPEPGPTSDPIGAASPGSAADSLGELEPGPAPDSGGGSRIERVSRSPMGSEADRAPRAVVGGSRLGPAAAAESDPGVSRLRPVGIGTGAILGLVIPLFVIAGLLAPPPPAPDVAAAGWKALEIVAFHESRGGGGTALVVQGRLVGGGSPPDLRLELRDEDAAPIEAGAHLLAGRIRPFDLERALARPADTPEAAAGAGGFTFVVPEVPARARRYSVRLTPAGGA